VPFNAPGLDPGRTGAAGILRLEQPKEGSWQFMRSTRALRPATLIALSAAMFAVVLALKLAVSTPGFGFPLLYDLPVALIAIAFGVRAGLAASAVGMVLYAIGDSASEIHSNVAGYLSRGLTFVLLAVLLGLYSERRRRDEQRFRGLLESTPDPMVIVDGSGQIAVVNAQAERLFGQGREELVGRSVDGLVPERYRTAHEDHRGRFFAAPTARPMGAGLELYARHADGYEIPVEISLSPLQTTEGTLVSAAIRDITERKRTEQALLSSREELARSNAELEQFASVASHDLSQPLRSVSGFVELLARRYQGKLDAEGESYLRSVLEGVERMQRLIQDLLRYSRAGQMERNGQPVDSRELVAEVLASLDGAIRDADAEVELGELPRVVADPSGLSQVFQNLISNAFKFRSSQPPRVEVRAEREAEGWRFSVADNGIGVERRHAERIFEMFERLHRTDEYDGTGIGLAICQRIVERRGGRIWCEPRASGGTVFSFTVPDAPPAVGLSPSADGGEIARTT
jgi:PAS domain S-box-containing protein